MRTLLHVRRHDEYFHNHPLTGTFSLIASMALAALIVVAILVSSAR
jgi:hypothetical protein